jgi:hypothetical protein
MPQINDTENFLLELLCSPIVAQSALGDLYLTFGIGGKVSCRFNERKDTFQGVVIQTDGKIVAAGNNGQGRLIVIRHNPGNTIKRICLHFHSFSVKHKTGINR